MSDKDNNMYRSSDDKFFAGVCAGMAHKDLVNGALDLLSSLVLYFMV
jgi:phage shock protein PspC (stress-responsive transcriptional regulator)